MIMIYLSLFLFLFDETLYKNADSYVNCPVNKRNLHRSFLLHAQANKSLQVLGLKAFPVQERELLEAMCNPFT